MSEQEPYSIEWHKGFQMGLYSGKKDERERIKNVLSNITWVSVAKTEDESRVVSVKDLLALIDESAK